MSSKKLDFKSLQDKWYAKLKKSGFQDIEYEGGGIKSSASRFIAENPYPENWIATEQYYRLASHFLHEFNFESRLDQVIWDYHSNGISVKNISATLKKTKQKNISKSTVANIIARLRTQMKLMYLPTMAAQDGN